MTDSDDERLPLGPPEPTPFTSMQAEERSESALVGGAEQWRPRSGPCRDHAKVGLAQGRLPGDRV